MSDINTDLIWRALGDFWGLFPEDERVYWETFWRAYADIVGDLWGFALQSDRAKSLFRTTETMERRQTLVVLSGGARDRDFEFLLSSVKVSGGLWRIRGFTPRPVRNFTARDIPATGAVRIGTDVLSYSSVNASTVVGGPYDGFVREATFSLDSQPPNDYSDSIDFADSFDPALSRLKMRVDHVGGEVVVDTVLVNVNDKVTINPTGRLLLGVTGVNAEAREYVSHVVIADRHLFTLAPGQSVVNFHGQDEFLKVSFYDEDRWSQTVTGQALIFVDSAAKMVVSDAGAGSAKLVGRYQLAANRDFDLSVAVTPEYWPAVSGPDGSRRAAAVLNVVGGQKFVIGRETRRVAAVNSEVLIYGLQGAETADTLPMPEDLFEVRFLRLGQDIELQYREDDGDWRHLATFPVTGMPATMDLVLQRSGLDAGARVSFDEVTRRVGDVTGSVRLETSFTATSRYPFTFDIDQPLSSATFLYDAPVTRSEPLAVSEDVPSGSTQTFVRASTTPATTVLGIPKFGVLRVRGREEVYDSVRQLSPSVFEFSLRRKIDPRSLPLTVGEAVTAETRLLREETDFLFDSVDRTISLRDAPTRDRLWAPVSQIDYRHVQDTFGVLVDASSSESSTVQYLRRVQGTWRALMIGGAIANVHSGLQSAIGLPVSPVDGTVESVSVARDVLGRVTLRAMRIDNERGSYTETMGAPLPGIDWTVAVGDRVTAYQPLTTGVEVLDYQSDPLWHLRFPGVDEVERFNAMGVFVALEALNPATSYADAIRFALRIKPTYTKLFIRFLLTTDGLENLFEDLDDDTFAASVWAPCDDEMFPHGEPPDDPSEILRLGEGHKLGQGKSLGGSGLWQFLRLDDQVLVTEQFGDGSWTAGADVFTSAGGYTFSASDIGHVIRIPGLGPDAGEWKIESVPGPTQAQVRHTFVGTDSGSDWRLIDRLSLGEGAALGLLRAFRCHAAADMNAASEVVDFEQVVTVTSPP